MNRYETVFIIDPDVSEPDQEAIIDRIRSLITQHSGKFLVFDDWGIRKFAYEIQKKKQGHYIRIEYAGDGDLVYAIERFFRIDHRVLKFMTIVLDKNVDPDSLPAEEPETSFAKAVAPEAPAAAESQPETPVTAEAESSEALEAPEEASQAAEASTETESEAKES
ncbi:MAG: 30S ribosomal protein S6 [Desulfobacterales bacterium]